MQNFQVFYRNMPYIGLGSRIFIQVMMAKLIRRISEAEAREFIVTSNITQSSFTPIIDLALE